MHSVGLAKKKRNRYEILHNPKYHSIQIIDDKNGGLIS